MVFSSIFFLLVFLPLFLIAYYSSPKNLKNYTALIFSVAFYAWGAPIFIIYLLGSCIIDHFLIKNFDRDNRKLFLTLSVLINIGLLLYFKYANFFVENANVVLEKFEVGRISWKEILLPIGVSFFTFQKLSYSLDIYHKRAQPLEKLSDYLLYITLFPQLIAGPIIRFTTIEGQIRDRNQFENANNRLNGAFRFTIGLAKKVLIANTLGELVDQIFVLEGEQFTTSVAWIGVFSYSFQIYFDFSGYSDMAIGLGKMIGFSFPENFNFPYISKSITEFWKRWHITLSEWMRDYLYIPLGGNRISKSRTLLNLGTVFFLSGLWHGAEWNFIIWGLYHGVFIIAERLFFNKLLERIPKILRIAITFLVVSVGWTLFLTDSFEQSWTILKKLFDFQLNDIHVKLSGKYLFYLILAILFSFIGFNKGIRSWLNSFQDNFAIQAPFVRIIGLIAVLFLISLCVGELAGSGYNPFIYYRF